MSKWTKKGRFSICCTIGGHKWELEKNISSEGISYFKCWHCGAKEIFVRPLDKTPAVYKNVDLVWLLNDD